MPADEPDLNTIGHGAASVFPYVMALAAFFLTGFIFLTVNLPLLEAALANDSFGGPKQALEAILGFWKPHIHRDSGATIFLLFCLAGLVSGFVVQPVALLITAATGWPLERISPRFRFYAYSVKLPEYPHFAHWLQTHRPAKVAWEWEFFNYYLFAGIFANVVVGYFAILGTTTLRCWHLLASTGLVLFFGAHALQRSAILRRMYDFYRPEFTPGTACRPL